MNKFTKLILTTAVFATGIMASESYVSGSLNVDGIINQNENADVTGAITVNDSGSFNNKATLAFKNGGALKIAAASELTANDYSTANTTYNLGVTQIGQYPVGSVKGFLPNNYDGSMLLGLTLSKIEGLNNGWKLVDGMIERDLSYICNTTALDLDPTDDLPTSISWFSEGPQADVTANITWEATPQSEEAFIAQVKAAIENSSAPKDEKTRLQNGSTLGGKFDNTGGILDFSDATGTNFSGAVLGGSVKLKDTTSATLKNLKVTGITANYNYASNDNYSAPSIDASNYIKVDYTPKTEGDAKTEFVNKFAEGSTITEFSGTPYGEVKDLRLTFPGILADGDLNKKEYKLKIDHIPTAVKDYTVGNGLDVNDTINIQFEGSDALQFATGKTDGPDQVIEFAGDNSKYTGSASFADGITKVVANGPDTLPVNLDSDMRKITLEVVSGANAIKTSGETTVKNLKLNSDATLTIAAGTTLNIGENSLS